MKRRDTIAMTDAEREAFLGLSNPASLIAVGQDGYPHATAMWYAVIDDMFHFATYAKSQKILNFKRNPKAGVLVEDGESYDKLRGVMVQGDAEVIEDPELAGDVMVQITSRYSGLDLSTAPKEVVDEVRRRAAKRAVVRIHPVRVATWDHAKLGGTY